MGIGEVTPDNIVGVMLVGTASQHELVLKTKKRGQGLICRKIGKFGMEAM